MPHSTSTPLTPLQTAFARDGYIVLPTPLTPTQLLSLRSAATTATDLARSGSWPHIRTLPRQFPPWPSTPPAEGIWGVQHLMHPSLPGNQTFTASYFSEGIISVVKELLSLDCENVSDEALVLELYNLLIRPTQNFALRWHRDDIPSSATPSEQLARLNKPAYHAQWNLALYDDASLIVIPGSHLRATTAEEEQLLSSDPYHPNLPNQKLVTLRAGEMVFYNNNILHRGVYDANVERMTLHGSMGHVEGGALRARNVLQHGREWIDGVDFGGIEREEERERAEGMRKRLVELGGKFRETGFAHDE